MNATPERPNREGMSRRDFVRGRFWKTNRRAGTSGKPVRSGKPLRRVSLVMRYPRTSEEVSQGDSPSEAPAKLPLEMSGRRRTIPLFRPPGAIDEASFLAGCTKCGECRQACPHDAIVHAPERLREAAGTPIIEADHQACLMCQDFPCIAACDPQVLTPRIPPVMGTARITEHLCLAHHGTTCTVCSERCPVEHAISVSDGKPTVSESACTGCGVCRHVCPAPENAILLMPLFMRPSPTENHDE